MMSAPSGSKKASSSGATLKIPCRSEEESIRGSCENIIQALKENRARSKSPNAVVQSDTATTSTADQKKQTGMDRYITVVKRKRNPKSPEVAPSTKIPKTGKGGTATDQNRFALLQTEEPAEVKKSFKPPPIYLREPTSNELVKKIVSVIGENSFNVTYIKHGRISETKIQVKTENDYRKLSGHLVEGKRDFYTYQLKSAKGLKVVLKGIDSCVDPTEVKEELLAKGFKVKNVINIRNREKIPQPMFKVELEPGDVVLKKNEMHPIYELRYLLYRKITVEEPLKRPGPVQCLNCQEFGHTKAYCKLPAVCVVCAEFHGTAECQKSKLDPSVKKCSNCRENHTANYRGCSVYVHLKRIMTNKKTVLPENPQQPAVMPTNNLSEIERPTSHAPASNARQNTYANTLKSKTPNSGQESKSQNPDPPIHNIETALNNLIQSMNSFTANITNMMQQMLQMQNTILQAILKR